MGKTNQDEYGPKEAALRRDEALRRALSTPPKPNKPSAKKKKSRRAKKKDD